VRDLREAAELLAEEEERRAAAGELGVHALERDVAALGFVVRLEHARHAAAPELPPDPIPTPDAIHALLRSQSVSAIATRVDNTG
jgi:hypothetical protein